MSLTVTSIWFWAITLLFAVYLSGPLLCFVRATDDDSCIAVETFGYLSFKSWLVKFGDA